MTGPRSLFAGMKFHVHKRTLARDKAEELIKEHGGEVVDANAEGRILLMDNQRLEKHADDHLNVEYIYECIKKKMLLDRDPFMAPADWADDDDDYDQDEPEVRAKRTRTPYTLPEQAAMLQYKLDMHLKLNQSSGCHRKFWTIAAAKRITNRTVESMLDHHKRRLVVLTLPQLREILTHFKGYAGDPDEDDDDDDEAPAPRPTKAPLPVERVKALRMASREDVPRTVAPRKQPHRTSRERRVPLDESAESEDFTDEEVPPPMFSTQKESTRLKRSQRSSHSSGSESDVDVVTRPKKPRVSARMVLSDENEDESDAEDNDDGVVPDSQQSHDSAATIDDATQTEESQAPITDAADAQSASKRSAKKKAAAPSPGRPKAANSFGRIVPRHKHTMRPIAVPGVVARPSELAPFPMPAPTTPAQLRALRKFMFLHSGMPDEAIDHALYSSCGNPVLAIHYLRGNLPLGCWTPDDDSWLYENVTVTSLTLDETDETLTALVEAAFRSAKPTRPHPLEMAVERLRFLVRELSMQPAPDS
ncbi:hypothetical protein SDRG_08492 [Saprolegnia diclina VS20]|uniref:BRCT domain-containing protein n=1 Tax=Saprolegnia diclina (strain VS20) TaxID=1156394 RepID=T0Q7F5_SAPDV|nr:hypothetical protein SDRG_08492 [Saprolegnia diclina VS20]EQC33809.1 hypothetical protein SDRG_08492 [Saprolegnia diclina VS20]|eukprot:XP_008612604.1 hypothetical protein SDRG_08492 [Saprolegnia diclina VS20]